MEEAVSLLRDRAAKAAIKVQRAEKALDSARTELSDLQTALRVLENLTGGSGNVGPHVGPSAAVAERQTEILRLLGVGSKQATAPADLFASYDAVTSEKITIDTFRTTVWRMKDKEFDEWVVRSDSGLYWKESLFSAEESAVSPASVGVVPNADWRSAGVHNVQPAGGFVADFEDDSDIPF